MKKLKVYRLETTRWFCATSKKNVIRQFLKHMKEIKPHMYGKYYAHKLEVELDETL